MSKRSRVQLKHAARRLALQALYQAQFADKSYVDCLAEFLSDIDYAEVDVDYFKVLVKGVLENKTQIQEQLSPFCDRPVSELNPIELSSLMIAMYEFLYLPDVPYRVVINESIELTKEFGTVEGHRFVNGVLDKAAKKLRKNG